MVKIGESTSSPDLENYHVKLLEVSKKIIPHRNVLPLNKNLSYEHSPSFVGLTAVVFIILKRKAEN